VWKEDSGIFTIPYNQFKVQLQSIAATFNLLLKIDSRSLIKNFHLLSNSPNSFPLGFYLSRFIWNVWEPRGWVLAPFRMVTLHPNPLYFRYTVFLFRIIYASPPTSIVSLSLFSTMVYSLNSLFAFIEFYVCSIFTNSLPHNRQTLTTFLLF
jgi:hypothetical protein